MRAPKHIVDPSYKIIVENLEYVINYLPENMRWKVGTVK